MHSRAYLLLRRDLLNVERLPLQGVSAGLISEDNLYKWSAKIEGLGGTVWEGGVFSLNISFSELYNVCPPKVHFMTIPFHPNVHPDSGVPMCRLLKDEWNEECTLHSLLLELQSLLSNPETDVGCVLNHEAARMYRDTPHTYKQLALDCVTASLRIDAGMTPYGSDTQSRPHSEPLSYESVTPSLPLSTSSSTGKIQKIKPVSFDDYHLLWKGLATSAPSSRQRDNSNLRQSNPMKKSNAMQTTKDDLERQMSSHLTLKYGISKQSDIKDAKTLKRKENRQKRIAELMELYRNGEEKGAHDKPRPDEAERSITEIDDLLKWTNSLDENDLNT